MISLNPNAGARPQSQAVAELADLLTRRGFQVQTIGEIAEIRDQAAELLRDGRLRCVIAAGGDGTVRLVAANTPPETPLAVLPLGTENLLAKYLKSSADPEKMAALIEAGCFMQMDAGEAQGRLFTLMAGCGFDAEVVRRVHSARTGNIQHFAYAKPILDTIRNYDYPLITVYYRPIGQPAAPSASAAGHTALDGSRWPNVITGKWVFIVNLPRYAGGLNFAPRALGDDGLLDICTFRTGSIWSGLWYLCGAAWGVHESMRDFQTVQTDHLRIEAAGPASYQLDGDPGGDLPVEIRILPRRLKLLVDSQWAIKHAPRSSSKAFPT